MGGHRRTSICSPQNCSLDALDYSRKLERLRAGAMQRKFYSRRRMQVRLGKQSHLQTNARSNRPTSAFDLWRFNRENWACLPEISPKILSHGGWNAALGLNAPLDELSEVKLLCFDSQLVLCVLLDKS
ncbi:hypothetical protein Q31a_51520 [Aureliella helgolandensis]|uniref:Uncharacterized protein n=1 Tax=Aureliella helgolandensis TaxID=2527968 RepID=A0A518GDV2_9BACT|nr:hypothetical protein Q31a_51520 [Aureliella helgolandensis]